MTVLEVVKTYRLGDFSKNYKDVCGCSINLKYPIDTLANMEVKDVYINLIGETATITVLPLEEELQEK